MRNRSVAEHFINAISDVFKQNSELGEINSPVEIKRKGTSGSGYPDKHSSNHVGKYEK
jgi:hypothetical protein